jgi:hypothetical protein
MKRRFILYRRKRGGMFYLEDTQSKKQESLHTKNRADAVSVLNARNESRRQPQLNLQIAKAYLSGTDSSVTTRTWQNAIESLTNSKQGANQHRWRTAARDNAFVPFALLGVVHHLLDANQVIHELFHRAGAVHFIDGDVGFTETAGTEPERNAADRAADGSRARLALSHEHERVGRM